LDLTQTLAGPFGAMLLGDLGAEIIKIEPPGGCLTRRTPPHYVHGDSTYFLSLNRSKKGLILDLKQETGRNIFYELVDISDVVFDNFRPGVMERLKLDYASLSKRNPRIICCSISGYGHTGPYRDRPGYDYIMQGIGGMMSLTGEPGAPPAKSGLSVIDHGTGMLAALGILTAIIAREKTGRGQFIDASLLDTQISFLSYVGASHLIGGEAPGKVPMSGHPSQVPMQLFMAKDDYIYILAGTDKFWDIFTGVIGRPELADDPRFVDMEARYQHKQELLDIVSPIISQKTVAEWMELIVAAGIPCGPVNSVEKALKDPQVLSREMVVELEHPLGGKLKMPANPLKMSDTPPSYTPPPAPGQHTAEILGGLLGYSEGKIEELRAQKVI
jgi:crotonobetainyl-CoA:carnitine CoA-transferase CaiB-like acyl-CoA transferase